MDERIKGLLLVIITVSVVTMTVLEILEFQRVRQPSPAGTTLQSTTPPPTISQVQAQTQGNPTPSGPLTTIEFEEYEYDFGTIKKGEVVRHEFVFRNTGEHPLIIQNATAGCGCTVPSWPREPIPPGGTGKIVVEFNSGLVGVGQQIKTVNIFANTDPSPVRLVIKGIVTE